MDTIKNIRHTQKLQNAIKAHAKAEYPKESCGLVIDNQYIECKNISNDPNQFCIDPLDILRAESIGVIQAYVHSHPNGNCLPSEPDRVQMNLHGKAWLICSYNPDEVANEYEIGFYKPDGYKLPLVGRSYFHGLQDCYSIIKDYYHRELKIVLNDYERKDLWWLDKESESLYLDNFKKEGFIEVKDDLRKHDVILFKIGESYHVNHAGVFLGDGELSSEFAEPVIGDSLFLHHPFKRLSIREIYGNYWKDRTYTILRHKDLV